MEEFKQKNQAFLQNPIIKRFLGEQEHYLLFLKAVNYPTVENNEKLDRVFKKYYFNIRFSAFISTSLYYNAVNFDKKQRLHMSRFPLTVDSEVQEEYGITFKDTLQDSKAEIIIDKLTLSNDIGDYIINPKLYKVVHSLSTKQKEVLNLAYLKGLSDTAIAKILNKSQQSVSKLHKTALKKIYDYMTQKESD